MPTSRNQRSATIDAAHHEWYKRIASRNPYITIAGMMRQAHTIYQQNYTLLSRLQRQLQDGGMYLSNAELVSRLIRQAIYKKAEITIVHEADDCSSAA